MPLGRRRKKPEIPQPQEFPKYPDVPTAPVPPRPGMPQPEQPVTPEEAAVEIFNEATNSPNPEVWLRTFSNYLHYLANK